MVDDTRTVMFAGLVAVVFSFVGGYIAGRYDDKIIHHDSIGSHQNDIYIQQGKVRYYSHVDGKSIDELVRYLSSTKK